MRKATYPPITRPLLVFAGTGTGRVLAPISAFVIPNNPEKWATDATSLVGTAASTTRVELPAPWAADDAMPLESAMSDTARNADDISPAAALTSEGEFAASAVQPARVRSVAQKLRDRMLIDLADGATRLL